AACLTHGIEDMVEERAAGNCVQHFRPCRAHTGALPGCEHDSKTRALVRQPTSSAALSRRMAAAVISECAAAGKRNAPSDLPPAIRLIAVWICVCAHELMPAARPPPGTVVEQLHARHTASRMQPALFLPTARQVNWLLLVALLSLGEALYLRYLAIEYAP